MALTPNFSCSQDNGSPSVINIEDLSTGADAAIASRRIYFLQSDGTYLVPSGTTTDYVEWVVGSSVTAVDCLVQDSALNITINWVNVGGTTLYTKTIANGFTAYNEAFYYNLTQSQVTIQSPNILLSTNYYQNKMMLRVFIDSGNQSISFASDIYSAQVCYDNATYLVANANYNF